MRDILRERQNRATTGDGDAWIREKRRVHDLDMQADADAQEDDDGE